MSDAVTSSDLVLVVRRALYLALTQHLEKDDAIEAVDMWALPREQGSNPLSGLRRYCHQVAERFNLQGREAELHLSILRSMKGVGVSRFSDSQPASGPGSDYPGLTVPEQRPEPSAYLVQRFVEAVERRLVADSPQGYSVPRWRESLLKQVSRLKAINQADLENWLSGRTSALQTAWPARGAGTQLINAVYVVLAQWVGPVRADQTFQHVVRQFESGQDAELKAVRSYL